MHTGLDGQLLPFGNCKRSLVWDTLTPMPTDWLETFDDGQADASTWYNAATEGGYLRLQTGTADDSESGIRYKYTIDMTRVRAIVWEIESFNLDSDSGGNCSISFELSGANFGLNVYQSDSDDFPVVRLKNSSGNTDYSLNYRMVNADRAEKKKYLKIVILTTRRELFVMYHDQVLLHNADFDSEMDLGTIQPSFKVVNKNNDGSTRLCYLRKVNLEVYSP